MDIATRFQPRVRVSYMDRERAAVPEDEAVESESQTRRKFQRTDVPSDNPSIQFRKPSLPASATRNASGSLQQAQAQNKAAMTHNRRRSTLREGMRVPSGPREFPGSPGKSRVPSSTTPTTNLTAPAAPSFGEPGSGSRTFLPQIQSDPHFGNGKPSEKQTQVQHVQQQQQRKPSGGSTFAFQSNRNSSNDDTDSPTTPARSVAGSSTGGFDFLPTVNFDDFQTRLRDYDGSSSLLNDFPAVGSGRALEKDTHQQGDGNSGMARNSGFAGAAGARVVSGKPDEGQERRGMTRSESFKQRISGIGAATAKPTDTRPKGTAPAVPSATQSSLSLRTRRQSAMPASAASQPTLVTGTGTARIPRKSVGPGVLTNMVEARKASQPVPSTPVEGSKPSIARTSSLSKARRTTMQPSASAGAELPRLSTLTATTQSRAAKVKSLQPPPRDQDPNTPSGRQGSKSNVNRNTTPTSSGNRRQSMASGRVSGLGARTTSPTDARRLKRMSMMHPPPMPTKGPPTPQQEEMPNAPPVAMYADLLPRLTQPSPSLIPIKPSTSLTPTSARASPEGRQGFGAFSASNLSNKSSYQSLNNTSSTSQSSGPSSSRLPTLKTRNVHSSSAQYGDDNEVIPPVPAIPKSYESPMESDIPFFSTALKNFAEPTAPGPDTDNYPISGGGTADAEELASQTAKKGGHGHRRTPTVGSTNGTTTTTATTPGKPRPLPDPAGRRNNNLQPLRLPPLNLLPLSTSINQSRNMAGLPTPGQDYEDREDYAAVQTPEPKRAPKTPSTPMTASKATFFRRQEEKGKPIRSSSSHYALRDVLGNRDSAGATQFWEDGEVEPMMPPFSAGLAIPAHKSKTSQTQTQPQKTRSAITPFASGSLPKGSGEFAHLNGRPSAEYSDDADMFNLGAYENLRLQNSKPLGPRPRTSGTVSSYKTAAETPTSGSITPGVTDQSAPPVVPDKPLPEKKDTNGGGLRRKLSLGWRRSSSKGANHAENLSKADEASKNATKKNDMPPPRLPASATWSGDISIPALPASTRSSLDGGRRKSHAVGAFGMTAASNAEHDGASTVAAVPKTRALHSEQPQPVNSGNRSSSWGAFNLSTRSAAAPVVSKPTVAPSAPPNGLPRPPTASRTNPTHAHTGSFISALIKDKDDMSADDEMRRLSQKRRDVDTAARETEELKRRAVARTPMTPDQVLRDRSAGLNIFERGEVVEFGEKGVYFTGTKNAKKIIGSLSSGNAGESKDDKGASGNYGYDDERGDYNIVFGDHLAYRYEVVDVLGKGSFGQVVRCVDHKEGGIVAVKIIRNKKRFHQQALVEVGILERLRDWDPDSAHATLSITSSFYFRSHLCIVTPCLGMNLYELIRAHNFTGFSLPIIRRFSRQLLASLVLLQRKRIIHCDLKPENILLCSARTADVRVIDFGSSCREEEKVYTYIQSRFYRSPEVILGSTYGLGIDMWSFGCILAELWTGYPIFPGENEQEQLACIMEIFGPPDRHLVDRCTRKKLFFDSVGKPRVTVSSKGRRRRPSSKTLQQALKSDDEAFLDFIARCLRWDPDRRMKPNEACAHPFIRNMPLNAARLAQGIPDEARRTARVRSSAAVPTAVAAGMPGSPVKRGNAFAQQQSQQQQQQPPQTPHRSERGVQGTPQTALRAPTNPNVSALQASPSKLGGLSAANRRHSSIASSLNSLSSHTASQQASSSNRAASSNLAAAGAVAGSKRASNGAVLAGHFGLPQSQRLGQQQGNSSSSSLAQMAARESMAGASSGQQGKYRV